MTKDLHLTGLNGVELTKDSDYKITFTPEPATEGTADSFKIALTKDYLKTLAGKTATERAIVVTYEATVNKYATTNFEPNKNTMTVTYNNKPDNGTEDRDNPNQKTEEDTTYHYTFEIDGKILVRNSRSVPLFHRPFRVQYSN